MGEIDVNTLAKQRNDVHANHSSSRPLSKDYQKIGIIGEITFSKEFNVPFDASLRPEGDRGVDFVIGKLKRKER